MTLTLATSLSYPPKLGSSPHMAPLPRHTWIPRGLLLMVMCHMESVISVSLALGTIASPGSIAMQQQWSVPTAWLSVARSQETLPSGRMVEAGPCAFTGLAEDSLASGPLPQPSSKCLGLAGHEVSSVSVHRGTSGPAPPDRAVRLVSHLV